jgi:hypothetical protein
MIRAATVRERVLYPLLLRKERRCFGLIRAATVRERVLYPLLLRK